MKITLQTKIAVALATVLLALMVGQGTAQAGSWPPRQTVALQGGGAHPGLFRFVHPEMFRFSGVRPHMMPFGGPWPER